VCGAAGAAFAAVFPVWWPAHYQFLETEPGFGQTLAVALQSLVVLSRVARVAGEMMLEKIDDGVGGVPVEETLKTMLVGGFVCATQAGAPVFSRDLAAASVYDLYDCLGLTVAAADTLIIEVVGTGEAEAGHCRVLAPSLDLWVGFCEGMHGVS